MQTLATSSRGAIAPRRTPVALARRGSAASVPASPASSRAPRSFFPRCVFRHVNRRARATRPAPRALNVPEPETLPEDSADEILAKVQRVKSLKKMRARHLAAAERNLGADEDAAFAASLSRTNRNLALEMVRVTESAAVAAARWLGKGDKLAADAAAVEAMRDHLSVVEFIGRVVMQGEGPRSRTACSSAPRPRPGPHADIAWTPSTAYVPRAEASGAAPYPSSPSPRAARCTTASFYMDKICVGPGARGHVDITKSPTINVHAITRALRKSVGDVTCVVLDRERHVGLVEELRLAGARIKLISEKAFLLGRVAIRICRDRLLFRRGRIPGGCHRRRRHALHGRRDSGHVMASRCRGCGCHSRVRKRRHRRVDHGGSVRGWPSTRRTRRERRELAAGRAFRGVRRGDSLARDARAEHDDSKDGDATRLAARQEERGHARVRVVSGATRQKSATRRSREGGRKSARAATPRGKRRARVARRGRINAPFR